MFIPLPLSLLYFLHKIFFININIFMFNKSPKQFPLVNLFTYCVYFILIVYFVHVTPAFIP